MIVCGVDSHSCQVIVLMGDENSSDASGIRIKDFEGRYYGIILALKVESFLVVRYFNSSLLIFLEIIVDIIDNYLRLLVIVVSMQNKEIVIYALGLHELMDL